MNVTRIPSSKVYELMPASKTEKKVGNKTVEVPALTTLLEELVRFSHNKYGYNENGDETMMNTSAKQTEVVGSNKKTQSSTKPTNEGTTDGTVAKYTGSLTADEIAKKYVHQELIAAAANSKKFAEGNDSNAKK